MTGLAVKNKQLDKQWTVLARMQTNKQKMDKQATENRLLFTGKSYLIKISALS